VESNEEDIESIYANMKSEGWNIDEPLVWGFFFYSNEEGKLNSIFEELSEHEYKIESIHENEDSEWVMQVQKIETLAADKLHRRNIAFNELAEAYGSYYDGWDVGQIA